MIGGKRPNAWILRSMQPVGHGICRIPLIDVNQIEEGIGSRAESCKIFYGTADCKKKALQLKNKTRIYQLTWRSSIDFFDDFVTEPCK